MDQKCQQKGVFEMESYNQNHRIGFRPMSKVASIYDALAISNRTAAPELNVSSFESGDNDLMRAHIQKEAALIDVSLDGKPVEKVAFMTGGLDLFAHVKGMLRNQLGMPDESSHELTSPIIAQTMKIQGQYGGDEKKIAERLVNEMQGQLVDNSPADANAIGSIQSIMAVTSTKSLEERIKQRLTDEAGLSSYDADRFKKTIVGEARDLATMIRPYRMDQIADIIVELIIEKGDPTMAYNLKDSSIWVKQIRAMLEGQAQ
jgi:hypothetical protein